MRRLVMVGWVVAAALTVPVTACSSGGGPSEEVGSSTTVPAPPASESSTTTSTTTSEPATEVGDEAAILEAVEGYWRTFLIVNQPPNPDHPAIGRYMAGPALDATRKGASERHYLSQEIRLPDNPRFGSSPEVSSIDGDSAVVVDCVIDDSILWDVPSNVPLNAELVAFRYEIGLKKIDLQWKVVSLGKLGEWPNAVECIG